MNNLLYRHNKYLKYLVLLSFITFAILLVTTPAHGAWYPDSNWQYRKQIIIKGSEVTGGPHASFPVLIQLASDADLGANAQDDGDDILFTSSDETTKIPHEIEDFNGSTGSLVAWVKVDLNANPANTIIYMYYGNSSASDQQLVAPTKSDVWSDYEGVWHLNEAVSDESTAGTHYDSTSNNNDGTQHNNNDATGKIARGQDFDGDNDYISVPSNSSLQPTTVVTLSGWIKLRSFGSGDVIDPIIRKGEDNDNNYQLIVDERKAQLVLDGGDGETVLGSTTLLANTWYYIVGTWQSGGQRTVYLNGVQNGSTGSFSGPIGTDSRDFYMGGRAGDDYSDSTLDEVRISKTYHTAQWIQTEYTNQNDPANFITVDVETSQGGGGNQAPTVDAGSNQTITLPAGATLSDASASDSDGPSGLTYSWTKESGPGTVTFTPGDDELQPTASFSVAGTYVLKLSAYDGETWGEDTLTITVNPAGSGTVDVSGYSCNMKITILGSEVQGGPHNDFPVLISLTDESLKTSGCGFVTSDNGYDILFTNSSMSSQLDHEIEKYDKDTGELIAWVKVDLNASPNNTEIYMYYGKSGVGDQQNPTGVWDSNYKGVWHLSSTPDTDGGTDEILDSTQYDNDGDSSNMGAGNRVTENIADALVFNGWNEYVAYSNDPSLNPTSAVTVEAWVSVTDTGDQDRAFVVKGNGTIDDDGSNPYAYALWSEGNDDCDQIEFCINDVDNDGSNCVEETSGPHLCGGGWHHLVGTYDGTALRIFIDGSPEQTKTLIGATITRGTSYPVVFGRDSLSGSKYTGGTFDEVRISNTARSADWIQTEYNNQSDPESFRSYEVNCPNQAQPEDFSCSMEFTIDNTMVSGSSDLVDFPVLISLTDDALKNTSTCGFVTNSNGYDILFTDSNDNQLDHEIAKYDGTTGELIAWVKKTISPTADDPQNVIRMYYGNSNVCGALENPTAVWDSNYEVVLHLQESGNGTSDEFKDSTSNGHHGTGGGLAGAGSSYRTPSRATGKFGYAQDFDGGNDLIRLNGVDDGSWTAVTVQAWINPDDTGDDRLFGKCWGTGSDDETWLLRKPSGGNFGVRMRTDTNYNGGYDPGSLSIGSWQHVAATWSASDNQLRVFKNGVQQGATTLNGSHLFSNSSGETGYPDADYVDEPTLGNTPGNDRDYDGKMQEARVSRVARSADWLLTEYNNQSDPSSFAPVSNNTCSIPEPNPADFRCWRPITIDEQYVFGSDPLENFPLLIKINSDPLLELSNPPTDCGKVQNSNGYDIIFTDESGTEVLDHEIEAYESGTGKLVAWVRIPQLSTYSDTVIRMYYGNANIGCPTENPAGVWDSNYMGVWHLSDTSGDTQDSTSHATSGSLSGSVSRGSWSNIYNSFNFGDSGELNWGNPSHLNAGTQSWTVSLWANIDYNRGDGAWEKIINKGKGDSEPGYEMELDDYNNNLYFAINDGSTQWGPSTGTSFTTDTWTYFVGVVDRSTQDIRLYKNGSQAGSNGIGAYGSIDVNDSLTIGKDNWGWPDARIEEVRVSNTARSADWIKTEWYNQNGSVAFYTLGDDSCESEYKYQYCKKITVDHNKVSGSSHNNFPLLVKLTTDDLKWVNNGGLVENEFGYDIAFKDENCNMLDYEIESYDKDEGTIVAWVRLDSLSGSTDTEVYMYYGNPVIDCPSDNPTGVWNSYYEAVYHLNDDFQDSTGQHNGTNHGATFTTGKIGNGALFDPTDGYDYIDIGDWSVGGHDMTIQAWVYPENFSQNDPRIISKCDDDSASEDNHVFMLSLYDGNNDDNRLRFRIRARDSWWVPDCNPPDCDPAIPGHTEYSTDTRTLYGSDPNGYLPTAEAWYFVAGTYEDDHSTEMQLYRDDGLNAGGRDHNGDLVTNSWDVWIGANPYGTDNSTYSWHGVIDEVRVLSMDLSQDWLRTEYNNINDPSSFYSLGSCTKAITSVTSEWREEF